MKLDRFISLLQSVDSDDFARIPSSATISNLRRFRALVERLLVAEEFRHLLEPILQSKIFETDSDEFVSTETVDQVQGPLFSLRTLTAHLPKILEGHATPPSEFSVSLKLPDPNDLKDALEILHQFEKALEQLVLNETIKGELRLLSWEVGSFWVDLYLATPLAVSLVGSVAWAAAVIRKKTLEGDLIEKKLASLEIENQALEELRKGLKKSVQTTVDAEALAVFDKHFEQKDKGEQLERIKFSIRTFAELIHKGAEIYPGLYAPEEVKNLFPQPAKLAAIASSIKQLEDIEAPAASADSPSE